MSLFKISAILATTLALATPALADPTVGLGLSFSFGGGKPQTGIGLRVFSDDQRDSFVGSVGVDYMFGTQSFRGTVGGAYLGNDTYLGLDMGLDHIEHVGSEPAGDADLFDRVGRFDLYCHLLANGVHGC